jgi:uncharacterized coiled-coil protein SlyX
MNVRTVSELSERVERLEAQVAEDRRVIESQQEALGFQQVLLRELTDAYDLFESAMIEMARHTPAEGPSPGRPNLRVLR